MKCGNAIDVVASNNGKISHASLLRVAFLDDTHPAEARDIARPTLLDGLQVEHVD